MIQERLCTYCTAFTSPSHHEKKPWDCSQGFCGIFVRLLLMDFGVMILLYAEPYIKIINDTG